MTIEARLQRSSGALTTLSNGRHVWNSDVGKALGSGDLAPDPHDLLDSALAACTALTLELYLRRQGWPATEVRVGIQHVESRAEGGKTRYELKRSIVVTGDLTEDQRSRLLEIANRCPVHRILEGEISISSELS